MRILFIVLILAAAIVGNSWSGLCENDVIIKPNPFRGREHTVFVTQKGRIYKTLTNYEFFFEHQPRVVICGEEKLTIDNKTINVERLIEYEHR